MLLGAGDPGRLAKLPDRADRREQPRLPPAGPGLREPRRAADGHAACPTTRDAGRDYAAAITALMCGEAYAHRARASPRRMGAVRRLREERASRCWASSASTARRPTSVAARRAWATALLRGAASRPGTRRWRWASEHGYRNSQVTVLAPTGTIGFMMDCDTTGIEPDIALVKYKKLVGGGMLKIVNHTVPLALREAGLRADAGRRRSSSYIDEHDTIEGAPGPEARAPAGVRLRLQAGQGRAQHPLDGPRQDDGAPCQPFLSGAISKTVNMPTDATVEDIEKAYLEAWKLGLKAVAVYRDGCKRSQPLNTSQGRGEGRAKAGSRAAAGGARSRSAVRRRLPDERQSITHKFSIGGHEGYMTVGMYEDGTPGELFMRDGQGGLGGRAA